MQKNFVNGHDLADANMKLGLLLEFPFFSSKL